MLNKSYFFNLSELKKIAELLLMPNENLEKVENINGESLYKEGYRTLFLDVDNTLMTYNEKILNLDKENWIKVMKDIGFKIYLISNNSSKKRILRVANQLDLTGIYFALKPFTWGLNELAEKHNINLKKSIVVGDQLFKDIICGNWKKAYTILVEPIDQKGSFIRTWQRDIELSCLNKLSTTLSQ